MRTEILSVNPRALRLLAVNAHSMPHAMFQQLVANIARDGALTSVPLVAPLGLYGKGDESERDEQGAEILEVLSGNHRTRAAIAAGLEQITVMVIRDPLPREQRVAIQLSHNSINGEDDPATLKQLYEQLDIDWRQYAALDDKAVQALEQVKIGALPSVSLEYQPLTFVFLPHEAERIAELFKAVRQAHPGELYLARWGQYDQLLDTLEDIGTAHGVRNGAAQLMLMLEWVGQHLDELQGAWLDAATGKGKTKTAPVSSLFGATAIPTKYAATIARALAAARERQVEPAAAVAQWAEAYLKELKNP
jgi:hypothetical protein